MLPVVIKLDVRYLPGKVVMEIKVYPFVDIMSCYCANFDNRVVPGVVQYNRIVIPKIVWVNAYADKRIKF